MKRQRANANKAREPTSKTARSDSEDPFYLPHCESDVKLVVEDKELHVHKAVLSVHSPVFGVMFTADFAEKYAKEIPLPGKKYDAMLHFLEMMYPVHSLDPVPSMYDALYLRTKTKKPLALRDITAHNITSLLRISSAFPPLTLQVRTSTGN